MWGTSYLLANISPMPMTDRDGMSSHVLTVYKLSAPSKELIAKKACEESNELEILKLLDNSNWNPIMLSRRSRHNRRRGRVSQK